MDYAMYSRVIIGVCIVVGILLVVVFTGISRDIGRKAAGATEALSSEEGSWARSAVDSISEDSVKRFGE